MADVPDGATFVDGYQPGVIAEVTGAHIAYYAREWRFGLTFEAKVATELSAFLSRYDPVHDLFLCARDRQGELLGSITIDGLGGAVGAGAHLRWFIMRDAARGLGLGGELLRKALQFSDERHYARIYLTTFAGLTAARHLYETHGFVLVQESATDAWHGTVGEHTFERTRPRG